VNDSTRARAHAQNGSRLGAAVACLLPPRRQRASRRTRDARQAHLQRGEVDDAVGLQRRQRADKRLVVNLCLHHADARNLLVGHRQRQAGLRAWMWRWAQRKEE